MILGFIATFLLGAIVGAIGLARWWISFLKNPEQVRKMLKQMYRNSHQHWLQVSKDDTRIVCPCCGWSETEALAKDSHVH